MHKLWTLAFGEDSMVRQAYFQFFFAILLLVLGFMPTQILILMTFYLSVWAIITTAQAFISAANGTKKLVKMLEHIEDLVEQMHKLRKEVDKITPNDS